MKANFKGVREATGEDEIVPAGLYEGICMDYHEDVNNKDGTGIIQLDWQLVGGEFEGHTVGDNLFLTVKGIRRAKAVCKRLGIKKDLDQDVELAAADFVGLKAKLTLEIERFQDRAGKDRQKNKVAYLGYNDTVPPPAASNPIDAPLPTEKAASVRDKDAPPW